MNTTSEFVKNMSSDNISRTVTRFFDEIMVLYNLLGHRQDIDICVENNSDSVATFRLLMDSDDDAIHIFSSLNGSTFSVYEHMYLISMELEGTSILTVIKKSPS